MIDYHMDYELYRADDAISSSDLREYLACPFLYGRSKLIGRTETSSKMLGSAFHTYLLEPNLFQSIYKVIPKLRKNSSEYKVHQEKNKDKILLFEEELHKIKQMKDSFDYFVKMKSKEEGIDIKQIFEESDKESSFFWSELDLDFKARLDAHNEKENIIIDIKTSVSVDPSSFIRKVRSYKYDFQAAVYCRAYEKCLDRLPLAYVLIAIQNQEPFMTEIYKLSDNTLFNATMILDDAISKYKQSLESDYWGTYDYGVIEI